MIRDQGAPKHAVVRKNALADQLHRPASQVPDSQSVPVSHRNPLGQAAQVEPPQSTSVSVPLRTASEQLGASQVPLVQTPDWQSDARLQLLVEEHCAHTRPPQSTSVSVPLATPSAHDGA